MLNQDKRSPRSKVRVDAGSFLVIAGCLVCKNVWYFRNVTTTGEAWSLSILDGIFFCVVLLAGLIAAFARPKISLLASIILSLIACWYLADCVSVIWFLIPIPYGYLPIAITQFKNAWILLGYSSIAGVSALLVALFLPRLPTSRTAMKRGVVLITAFLTLECVTYRGREFSVDSRFFAFVHSKLFASEYPERSLHLASGSVAPAPDVPFAKTKRPIVIVFFESLSAIDSKILASDGSGFIPQIDELSKNARFFSNFYANSTQSINAYIATFLGVPLLRYPGAPAVLEDAFAGYPSLLRAFSESGYQLDFVSGQSLHDLCLGGCLTQVGFERMRQATKDPAVPKYKQMIFDSVDDRSLYKSVIARIKELQSSGRPFLLGATTSTTHEPYIIPGDNRSLVDIAYKFADAAFVDFYRDLERLTFFDTGVLIVMGDHHRRALITPTERERYGCSARMRVPLMIFGKGFTPAIDARAFQQSDLLSMLHLAATDGTPLSNTIYFVDWYANQASTWFKVDLIEPNRSLNSCRQVMISDEALRLEGADMEGADAVFASVEERLSRSLAFRKPRIEKYGGANCQF